MSLTIPTPGLLYEMFSPNVYAVHTRNDVQGDDMSSFGIVMAQWGQNILCAGSGGFGIKEFDVAAETLTTVIASGDVISVTTMLQDTSGRLVTAGLSGARRYNPDLSIDTTVTWSFGAQMPNEVAIDPDGDYVYGVSHTPNLVVDRWSIDGGGGAPTSISSRSAGFGFGAAGIGVHTDGSVLVAAERIDGSGLFLTDPYVKTFWLYREVVGAAALDITAWMPDLEHGQAVPKTSSQIVAEVGGGLTNSKVMPTEHYNGHDYVWFLLFYNRPSSPPEIDSTFVVRVDIASGVTTLFEHLHDNSNGDKIALGSTLMLHTGLQFPGLSKFRQSDLSQRFFLAT